MTLSAGTKLGPYEILSPLGAGGMGEVYRARDTRLGRDVAIKALPPAFAQDPERLARFEREAKLLALLSHPNIAGIFGIEEGDGTRYLVLEFVDGETLATRVARGVLPLDDAIEIALQIATGVEAAHEAGVVHRDLKPGNVMLTHGGQVKVLDFGLARSGGNERAGSDPNLTSSPTRTYNATQAGVVMGTAAYMSPEQARGKSVDRRTDIWSFGCVLFECLTGRPLFDGETVSDLIAKILQTEPDWGALPAETPSRLRALLKKCLRRDSKERLRDIGDARIELSEILTGGADATAVAPATRGGARAGAWRWTVAVATVIAVVSAVMLATRKPAPAPLTRLDLMSPDPAVSIHFPASFAISPDGRAVAFVVEGPGHPGHIVVRELDRPELRTLDGTSGAAFPFWSPDSRHIAFFAEGKLRRIPAAGGGVQNLCDVPAPRGGSWGSGEIIFAMSAVSPLYRVVETGGAPVAATDLDSTRGESSHRFPTFLPDGRHFVFGSQSSGDDRENTIRVGSLDNPEMKVLPVRGVCPTFAAPEYVLFVRDETLMAQSIDLKTFEPRGAALLLDSECNTNPRVSGAPVGSASLAGTLVLGTRFQRPTQLSWQYPDGRVEPAATLDQWLLGPSVSPDGTRVALIQITSGKFTTWLVDLRNGSSSRIGQSERGLRSPVWSPDGARLAGLSLNSGRSEVRVMDLATGTDSLLVPSNYEWGITTAWSEGANAVLFSPIAKGRGLDCRYITLGGKREMRDYLATNANEGMSALSPDGRWIAYWSDASGTSDVVVDRFPTPSGARRVQTGEIASAGAAQWGVRVWWSKDGRSIVYNRPNENRMGIIDVRTEPALSLGEPRALMELPSGLYGVDYDAARGRVLIAAPIGTARSSLIVIQNWERQLEGAE